MWKIIDITEGRLGKKVVSSKRIRRNSVIYRFTGVPVDFKETKHLGTNESFGLQIGVDCYIYLDMPARFFNHSCDPNCGLTQDLQLIALKNIDRGEELTYDYSTTMLERDWTMDCKCGREKCRREVSDFDRLPEDIRNYYISRNVVQRYIIKAISNRHEQ
jgi:uncharacterized protein